jgi:hypothetical protein
VLNRTILASTHFMPQPGARKLAQLSAEEVDGRRAKKLIKMASPHDPVRLTMSRDQLITPLMPCLTCPRSGICGPGSVERSGHGGWAGVAVR